MSFPPSFLEEIRSRLPLSEVVGKKLRLTRAGREYKGCCPFHNEKSPSFYVNDDKQFFHCFGCGAHGDVIGFTMRSERLSFPEAIESLAAQAGLQVPRDTPVNREQFDQEKRFYALLERTTAWFAEQLFAPIGREALAYLHGRGLSDDAIRRFQLGFAPQDSQALIRALGSEGYKLPELVAMGLAKKSEERSDHYSFFRNRVMFPVGDRRGRTVAFGGRVMGDGEPKYLNSPDHPLFHKGKLLYGLSRARAAVSQNQPIIVVEGYMDVIALVEAGFSGAVAPLGTALTEDQMTALWKLLPPFDSRDPTRDYSPILCFDGDAAGARAALRSVERALPLLSSSQTFRIARIDKAKDPDELIKNEGRGAMETVLNQALPMIDVLWNSTIEGRRLQTPEDRGAFIAAIKQRVARIANENLRKLYQDDIDRRLNELLRPAQKQQQQTGGYTKQSNFKPGSFKSGGSKWGPPETPAHLLNRRAPPNAQTLRERVFLAIMVNHPALFADFGEEFAQMEFKDPVFSHLRQRLVEVLTLESHENLDAAEVNRHLSALDNAEMGTNHVARGLADALSATTYMYASYARPEQPIDIARAGWKSLWNKQLQEKSLTDLQAAKRHYASNPTEENYARLMALRQEVELMATQETEHSLMVEAQPSHTGQE